MQATPLSALLKQDLHSPLPVAARAKGVYIYDESGRDYLDGCGGAMTVSIGHGAEDVLQAMRQQAEKVCFAYRTQFTNRPAEDLALQVTSLAPAGFTHASFVNSGSEATELAMRASIQYWRESGKPRKARIIGRRISYHGMTMGALSMSGHPGRRADYANLLHEFARAPGLVAEPAESASDPMPDEAGWLQVIQEAGQENVAALIVEPIVGAAGGALVPEPGHLRMLRRLCDEHDILLIADEVITGMGRTGEWFGVDHERVVPDLIAMGKGMTSGYTPMGAVLFRDRIVAAMKSGSGAGPFAHTFSANPLSAAVALAVVRHLKQHDILDNVRLRGAELEKGLRTLARKHASVMCKVRGRGLLWGFDVAGSAPRPRQQFVEDCFAERLIVYPSGIGEHSACIVAPPLNITASEVAELLTRLEAGLARFSLRTTSREVVTP